MSETAFDYGPWTDREDRPPFLPIHPVHALHGQAEGLGKRHRDLGHECACAARAVALVQAAVMVPTLREALGLLSLARAEIRTSQRKLGLSLL